jgi:hypothetical protein
LKFTKNKKMKSIKKTIAYFFAALVLIFAVIAILGIWDVIELDNLFRKMFGSALVIMAASAVIVFLFGVLIRENPDRD